MANIYTDPVKIIELKESVLEDNNKDAQDLRRENEAVDDAFQKRRDLDLQRLLQQARDEEQRQHHAADNGECR